ncbi:MAG: hypothetical protein ACRDRL_02565, partial [Sciscionella sp.]
VPAYLLHHRKSQLTDEEVGLLRRWVYSAMAFSHYSNQVEGKLDVEARLARDRSGPPLFHELLRRASGPRSMDSPIAPDDLVGKGASSPLFNLLYIAALRNGAKDWCSNTAISAEPMSSGSKIEYHHVFPQARIRNRYGKELMNNLGNLAFISGTCNRKIAASLPERYLTELHVDRLAEQWIPEDSTLWRLDAFEAFLTCRRTLQAAALNDLLGLPQYEERRGHEIEDEFPEDEDTISTGYLAEPDLDAEVR